MKASHVAANQAKSLENLSKLVMALCEKQGIDVDKVLGIEEPQTREEMKAYAFQTKLPAPTPAAVTPVVESPAPASAPRERVTPAKGKQSKSK